MNVWFNLFITLTVSGAVLCVILWLITRGFARYLGRRWQYYIWLVLVARLLLPLPAPVNLGITVPEGLVGNILPGSVRSADMLSGDAPSVSGDSGDKLSENIISGRMAQLKDADLPEEDLVQRKPAPSGATYWQSAATRWQSAATRWQSAAILWQSAAILWLTVASVLFARRLWNYRRALRILESDRISTDLFDSAFERACDACGQHRKPRLLVCRTLPAPVTVGVIHPMVAVPADFSPDRAYYVFLHEITHVRCRDSLYKWAVELAVCLHWFNPAVYVMRRETQRACELSCDEAVIGMLDGKERRIYGDLLLAVLGRTASGRFVMLSKAAMTLPLGRNATCMKERLGAIMGFKKKGKACVWTAFALTAVLAVSAALCGFAPLQTTAAGAKLSAGANRPAHLIGTGKILQNRKGDKTAADKTGESGGEDEGDDWNDGMPDTMSWNSDDMILRSDQKRSQVRLRLENKYMVALGWNVDSTKYETVRQMDGKTVCFTSKTAKYADHTGVTEAIRLTLESAGSWRGLTPSEVVVLGVDGPFDRTADELAEEFYESDRIPYFSAVIHKTGQEKRRDILERAYKENKIEYFAVAVDAGEESWISGDELEQFAVRAVQDKKVDFFAVLSGSLSDPFKAECAMAAYETDDIGIFYQTCEALSAQQLETIADRVYKDNKIEYFYAIVNRLTDAQRTAIREQARRDGKDEFRYALP